MNTQIVIDKRFCGPPRSGNGGYVCGTVAKHLNGVSEVKLLAPPPLGEALNLVSDGESAELLCDNNLIAKAKTTDWKMDVPPCPNIEDAQASQKRYVGFTQHALPGCFVCGPNREEGDGLRIFAGPDSRHTIVAAVWIPQNLPNTKGVVNSEFIWAALDCPGFFAVSEQSGFALLGNLSVKQFETTKLNQRYIIIGWHAGSEGRKHVAGTAIYHESGKLAAQAKATWVSVDEKAFV